ncbi:hypothetical protein TNCV_2354731 [Trichonephila clavipes]|nr:hypothetical protein TNCV_2354731 [Trichonephila clavipes]
MLYRDNVHRHKIQLVDDYLESEGICPTLWSVRFPDLNLIKHIWNTLEISIKSRHPTTGTIPVLKKLFCLSGVSYFTSSCPVCCRVVQPVGCLATNLCPDDHRRRVWRQPGTRADPAFTIAQHTGPQQGVMVKDAISFEAVSLAHH